MGWAVNIKKKVARGVKNLPRNIQEDLMALIADLEDLGPMRGDWPNYSKLSDGSHHCHLNYSYVAVWIVEDRKLKIIEVIYVGSRENAPY